MRAPFIILASLVLFACDSGNVPSPAERAELRASEPVVSANDVMLRGDGFAAGAESFYFAAGRNEAEAALAGALGKASQSGDMDECGAGPMASSTFPGGLTVNFQNGSLVGWFWRDEAENISVSGGISIGMPQSEIEAMDGFTPFEDSTLGEEFSLGEQLGGFFEEGRLSMLYAGTQCFFR